jgi:hypothetical protein
MENDFLDLEDKINLIYDYLYNVNTKNCFSFDKISLGKISIDDIKISIPEGNNDLEFYTKTKEDLLSARFKISNYDDETKQIILKRYSNQFPVNIKVNFYSTNEKANSFDSKVNNDSLFSYLLSQLVLGKKTKHLLLPIINIDCDLDSIENIIRNDNLYGKIKSAINSGEISNKCCLQLREHFFKSTSLEDYLSKNICSYKGLLFQLVHTLATIQNEFDGFRHNNLLLKNIIVYLKKSSDTYTEYDSFGKNNEIKYYLPNYGFDIKITNFENSIIPKYYGLANLKNNKIKFADQPNSYYDLYVFLNDLLEGITKMSSYADGNKCDTETKKFLERIIPPHIRGINMDKFKKNMIIVSPIELLNDKYFEEYKNKPSKNLVEETMINHQYLTGKQLIDTFMDSDNYSVLGRQDKLISKSNIMINSRTLKKSDNKIKGGKASKDSTTRKIFEDFDEEQIKASNVRQIKTESDIESKINRLSIDDKKIKSIKGGSIDQNPYKTEKNTPFVSNEERDIHKKRMAENPIREPPVLLEQKIYDTSQKPPPKAQFPPTFIPLYDQGGDVMNQLLPYSKVINQPPVQKVYNINLQNQLSGNTSLNRIYEDMLPGNPYSLTAISLYERKQLIDFFRNSILQITDGEEMTMAGGKNSFLSYIKVMDVNPYTSNKNPYYDLPRNFILYRAGYPVRFDEKNKVIGLSKQSMGINIRMYMMSLGDLRCKTINNNINADNFDLWREIKYYDWVRDNLIKRKVSPNFIAPILYKIDSESKINWSQLETIKAKGLPTQSIIDMKQNQEKINDEHNIDKSLGLFQALLPLQFRRANIKVDKDTINTIVGKKVDKEDLTVSSGKTLVLLTEAPTCSFVKWSSTVYETFGVIRKMVSTGHHTPDVWKSVLFQLVYSMTILQEKGIYIKNFSLENNIFIKDIFVDPNAVGSWIYKIDNIEYYVPNFGYILMIDSKYTDADADDLKKNADAQVYKIYGSLYDKNGSLDNNNIIKSLIYTQFKELIDPDNFTHSFRVKGGSRPDDSIIALLKGMYNDTSIQSIRELIPKFFGDFVHNRVGTLLLKSEKDNVFTFSRPNFQKGNLMVWEKRFSEFEWVIYVGDVTKPIPNPLKKQILIKSTTKYEIVEVFTSSLLGYPENEKIAPDSKRNMKYDESHIYETYNLDDLN